MIDLVGLAIRNGVGLTYDDVLLVPQHSSVISRSDTDLFQYIKRPRTSWMFEYPVLSDNMD